MATEPILPYVQWALFLTWQLQGDGELLMDHFMQHCKKFHCDSPTFETWESWEMLSVTPQICLAYLTT